MANEQTVDIYHAQSIGDEEITEITIRIHVPVKKLTTTRGWEAAYRDMYREEGVTLADALCDSLPGGTLDALLVELLDRKRSLLVIPLFSKEKT